MKTVIFVIFIVSFSAEARQLNEKSQYKRLLKKKISYDDFSESMPTKENMAQEYLNFSYYSDEKLLEWIYPSIFIADVFTGWRHPVNRNVNHLLRTQTEIIWDVQYKYDKFSRRHGLKKKKEKDILLYFLDVHLFMVMGLIISIHYQFRRRNIC